MLFQNADREFIWVDGWPQHYTKWLYEETSNDDDCVIMTSSGEWDAITCANTSGFICKFTQGMEISSSYYKLIFLSHFTNAHI